MVDVFVSYSRSDHAFVERLAEAIRAEGFDLWWDVELPPHLSYGDVITEKITQAKAVIVVWSSEAVKSEWVRAEADMARNQRKLVQIATGSIMPPLPFNQIQFAEMAGWNGEANHAGWSKVKASLGELCASPSADGQRAPPRIHPSRTTPPPVATSRWPLMAGSAIALVGLAVAGGVLAGRNGNAPAPVATGGQISAPIAAPMAPQAAPQRAARPITETSAATLPDQTFPDSSSRLLTESEIASLGPATLRIARNEIYARRGRRFADPELRAYFGQFGWYHPVADEVSLNVVEQHNVALLAQAEARFR